MAQTHREELRASAEWMEGAFLASTLLSLTWLLIYSVVRVDCSWSPWQAGCVGQDSPQLTPPLYGRIVEGTSCVLFEHLLRTWTLLALLMLFRVHSTPASQSCLFTLLLQGAPAERCWANKR